MGEMISMIAHQWRQPLNVLSMLNQTIILNYKLGKVSDEIVSNFEYSANKQIFNMSQTIDDFSNFFKPEKKKVKFSINDLIYRTIDIVKPIYQKNKISIKYNYKEDIYLLGYQNELGQSIINIINNAKDAFLENKIENKTININIEKQQDNVILSISDNAGGIPTDIIDKIFDPYFSTKTEKNGIGIGLYMTKMIIEEHMDGKLNCSNSENGATFLIILPL